MKPTPGPWIVTDEHPVRVVTSLDRDGIHICTVNGLTEDAYADARLIAAAPELLTIAEKLAQVPIEDFGWQNKPSQQLYGWNGYYLKVADVLAARAAIAKAQG